MNRPIKHIVGDLTITKDNAHLYDALKKVTGTLFIEAEASLPVLAEVGRMYIRAEASLPALKTVNGKPYGSEA